jgi:hypothetical protein
MSSSAELLSFETDCNVGGPNVLLRITNGIAVRRDAGANEDTNDAIARKHSSGLIVGIYQRMEEREEHHGH